MGWTEGQVFYWILGVAFACMIVSLLSRKACVWFYSRFVRFALSMMMLLCTWGWLIDLQGVKNTPDRLASSDTCEAQLELMEFKHEYAKLQRNAYLKFAGMLCFFVCLVVSFREIDVQQELQYYKTSARVADPDLAEHSKAE